MNAQELSKDTQNGKSAVTEPKQGLGPLPKFLIKALFILFFLPFIWSISLKLDLNAEKEAHDKTTEIALTLVEDLSQVKAGLFSCTNNESIKIDFDSVSWAIVQCKRIKTNVWTTPKK